MSLLTELLSYSQGEFQLNLTENQHQQFARYRTLLATWNDRLNLTTITDEREVVIKHFLDSLSVLVGLSGLPSPLSPRLIDVGTGGGFPGLPIAIARPGWQMTLLEATAKKTDFLKVVVADLGLPNVTVQWGRAEELGHDPTHREQYDGAVARAVAELAVLVELCLPFVRPGGRFVAQKASKVEEEVARSHNALNLLGGQLLEVKHLVLPGLETEPRALVIISKTQPTPTKYPRRPGMPNKRPLL
jgi:16S rRNA (guanine527-N7)-methyltransferase